MFLLDGEGIMTALDVHALTELGFREIGHWQSGAVPGVLSYLLEERPDLGKGGVLDKPQALYAFVSQARVLYIGKTARTIRQRLMGYCRPGTTQRTNVRCNKFIQECIARNEQIDILIFRTGAKLKYGNFDLNVAAGLEDALITSFCPPWNGSDKGQTISEEAERELAEPIAPMNKTTNAESSLLGPQIKTVVGWEYAFEIKLGKAYYYNGIINPGVAASGYLGKEGEMISVLLGVDGEVVKSRIDRTANSTGAVRLVGSNQRFADWFQKHFRYGDTVSAKILDPCRVVLLTK
jgi:hypothetical protein